VDEEIRCSAFLDGVLLSATFAYFARRRIALNDGVIYSLGQKRRDCSSHTEDKSKSFRSNLLMAIR
jgi:hypothetical protein